MSWFFTNLVATLLLPPLSLLMVLGLGIGLFYRYPRLARVLLVSGLSLFWIAATPYFAEGALHLLEERTSVLDAPPRQADAIVILGGGTYFKAPEYSAQDTISAATLIRLRYGAKLYRETGKPILVTGGKPVGNNNSEAQQMRSSLIQDFQVPVRWIEESSDNTLENARNSFLPLHEAGVKKIYLITHAWHMPRAAAAFRHAGFTVIEAPTAFTTRYQIDLLAFLPRAESLLDSKIFLREVIGLLWYQVKFTGP